jgi:hypothetical protein
MSPPERENRAPQDPAIATPNTTTRVKNSRSACQSSSLSERGHAIALSDRYARRGPIPPVGQMPDLPTVFVGTLLWSSPEAAAEVLELVADDDLESPALSVLMGTVRRLATAGRPCDAQIVMDELGREGGVHRGIALALMDATASGAVLARSSHECGLVTR